MRIKSKLHVTFMMHSGGALYTARDFLRDEKAFVYFYSKSGDWKKVEDLSVLEGLVSIKTEADALQFVRLMESPSTYPYSTRPECEPIRQSDLSVLEVYGRGEMFKRMKAYKESMHGVIVGKTVPDWFEPPSVRKINETFVIDRTVIRIGQSRKAVCVRVQEVVTSSGNLIRSIRSRTEINLNGKLVTLFRYV